MAKSTYQEKKLRMDRLLGILKSEDHSTTEGIAKILRVSHRTLMRDIEELRASGVPIEADRGRGGGIRLNSQWGLGRLQLNYKESLDLILSLAVMEKSKSPLLLTHVRSLRDKVFQSFPDEHRKKLQLIRKRVLITELASKEIVDSAEEIPLNVHTALHEAFFEMKVVKIFYQDGKKQITERDIEAHYLLLSWPLWYVIAWDHLRNDLRSFRVDRIKKAQIQSATFRLHHQDFFTKIVQSFSESL
ncbi:MAG: WYL domain-containing protein [Bdellovibrionota bacterium]